jgi:hypothetical protein
VGVVVKINSELKATVDALRYVVVLIALAGLAVAIF